MTDGVTSAASQPGANPSLHDVNSIRCEGGAPKLLGLEITPGMIEAGVEEAREHALGAPLADLVVRVFLAMSVEAETKRPRP